ncbi:putative Short-chain dehydrogenase [Seiridium unicorne]|uniref:Short-chain dehydrogenase n=1 Tax=Seiridium unicorne TaxID=138068 RepID=A0ABR2VHA0_9PEZI
MSAVLIIGAGPNIGLAVAKTFAGAGYKVALASRSKATDLYTHFTFDASKPETFPQLFEGVRKDLGDPKVVVHNGKVPYYFTVTGYDLTSAASCRPQISTSMPRRCIAAAKEAVDGFARTGPGSTFIFTGNKLNVWGQPQTLAFGMGKSATAHLARAGSKSFEGKGYKFYYVDQRQSDGGITFPTGTEARANTFLELADDDKQRAWHCTFVDGKGYVDFQER